MEKVVIRIKKAEDTIKVQAQLLSLLTELERGKTFDCTIEEHRQRRSLNANSYFHLLVDKLAKHYKMGSDDMKKKMVLEYGVIAQDNLGKKIGIKMPENQDITIFYPYAKWFAESVEKGIKFNHYLFYKQTHTLDSKEMATLIDGVVTECKDAGIETLDDLELKRLVKNWEDKR
jgi:hypothetical protein